jgi:hypothetical protein
MLIYWPKNAHIIYINTGILLVARKEVGLEVNAEKMKHTYMSVYRDQNSGQNDKVKIGNKSFNNVTKINTLETKLNTKIFTKKK